MLLRIDQFHANNKAGKIKLQSDNLRAHAAIMMVVLKNKDYNIAIKSYKGDGGMLLRKLGMLVMEMRNHKLAIKMSQIQQELHNFNVEDESIKNILSLRGDSYALTKAFNDNEYCPVAFTELHDLTERYLIKIQQQINLG